MNIGRIFWPAAVAALVAMPFGASAADYTLKLGSVLAPTDPLQVAAEGMKKAVEERSGGQLEIELYPSSQLGDTQDMMDQAAAGANVGTFVEASRVSVFVPQFDVLVAPYAFDSVEEIARFVETDTFANWNDQLREKSGLTLLSFNWYQGARHLLTKKPVSTPADLDGVRVRTIGQPLWVETIGAMGAVPTPLAWAEVYPSIQTGAIDGAEAQPSAIWGSKLHEVVSDITLTGHIHLMSGLLVSDAWLQSLPEDLRAILTEEAKNWGASALKDNVESADTIFADIREAGVNVTEIDTTPFKEAVKPVYEKLNLTEMVEEVRAALGE
ncbi:C4-dicarboxylate TRAP transporter substrate-binding protein [Chelativorans xinjiangense]|uniref:C4-dicarboxylate TRAP transporter substrate-binding protein n=1 Tax=Chelativorans xinjiangense TaxID=2681485 RepID=UPI00135B7CB2|nr:C4-dicarboxylate TRAP transporter substrate-binding protein [Chelativorans xinjiangense]